jgi:hypothetical protein
MQIPSNLRGIPMHQWELSFSFVPRACALDPSEVILVVLQQNELVALDPIALHAYPLSTCSRGFTHILSQISAPENPIL